MKLHHCIVVSALALSWGAAQDKSEWPRVMVVLDEQVDGVPMDTRTVSAKIEELFLEKGFRLVDRGQFEQIKARDVALAESDPTQAKAIGQRYGADVLLVGKASAMLEQEQEIYGVKNVQFLAKADVKALITDTGELVAVSNKSAKRSAQSKPSATRLCLESVAEAIASDLYVKVRLKMVDEKASYRVVQLAFFGMDERTLTKYQETLPKTIATVKYLKLRYLEKEVSVYEAGVYGTADELRGELSKQNELAIIGFTGSRITVTTKDKVEGAKSNAVLASPLEITDFSVENIFPSQVNYYATHPLAKIEMENGGKADIRNVKVSVFIPDYMNLASEQIVPSVAAGSKQTFQLSATLDGKKLSQLSSNVAAQAKIELSYTFNNQPQTRSLVRPVTIYSRNTISWKRGESIGAFVTESDEAVETFARFAVGKFQIDEAKRQNIPHAIANALLVWNALRAHSIVYVSDPWKSVEGDILDKISYPREILASRTGDCDDMAVLFSACLENVGIQTKFVATSDHIYMMFNAEINPKNGYTASQAENEYVVSGNEIWIPVETTMLNKPFGVAWRTGAEEYHKAVAASEKLELIDTRKASMAFPPSNFVISGQASALPASEKVIGLINEDVTDFEYHQSSILAERTKQLQSDPSAAGKVKQANLLAKAGSYKEAVAIIGAISTAESENTLGNIAMLQNDLAVAQEHYQKSIALNDKDGGVYMNFGLARYLAGSSADAVESFQAAMGKFKSPEEAFAVLGLDRLMDSLGVRAAERTERKVTKGELFDLLNRSLQTISDKSHSTAQASKVREKYKNDQNRYVFGGRRGADPTQISSIKEFVYWRE